MSSVKSEFYNVKKLDKKSNIKYDGDWYMVEITPLPAPEEMEMIISDLVNRRIVSVSKSTSLKHFSKCENFEHSVDDYIMDIIPLLKETRYKVLIKAPASHQGKIDYHGQPLVFILDPYINHERYPDHPHINAFTPMRLPSSICYFDDYDTIKYMKTDDKIVLAVQYTSIYLFIHQIWELLKDSSVEKPWITPDSDQLSSNDYLSVYPYLNYYQSIINPNGRCHCGSGKKYRNCHMPIAIKRNNLEMTANLRLKLTSSWEKHNKFENDFRDYFLNLFNEIYN